jgi:hypothetical protein
MKECFKPARFNAVNAKLIEVCNTVIDQYTEAGLRLTLRQLYYQLVSANVIPNEEKAYKSIGALVSKARLAGLMDWDAIEDRVRQPRRASEWRSIQSLVDSALYAFRLPRLKGQPTYVEVWVEKDALAGVLSPLTDKYHLVLMVNRGYSSQSAMYESADRIIKNVDEYGCDSAVILYLGDLDPSGEDMVRDLQDRLVMFGAPVVVQKVALNMDQVTRYNLPPNPAKLSDSRSGKFVDKFGTQSWELDAIPPQELQRIVTGAIEDNLDLDLMEQITDQESELKALLRTAAKAL